MHFIVNNVSWDFPNNVEMLEQLLLYITIGENTFCHFLQIWSHFWTLTPLCYVIHLFHFIQYLNPPHSTNHHTHTRSLSHTQKSLIFFFLQTPPCPVVIQLHPTIPPPNPPNQTLTAKKQTSIPSSHSSAFSHTPSVRTSKTPKPHHPQQHFQQNHVSIAFPPPLT